MTATGDYEDHWFIEIDRGTESLPTVLKQVRASTSATAAPAPNSSDVGVFPLVVWVVPDQTRHAKIATAIHAARQLDRSLFRVTTLPGLRRRHRGGAS